MKRIIICFIAIFYAFITIGCSSNGSKSYDTANLCNHSYSEATCIEAAKCYYCGDTIGNVSDHNFESATCLNPEKCTVCGETRGTAKDHSFLQATCEEPKKCTTCGLIQGSALGHNWSQATCTTPAKCTNCEATNGTALGHDVSNLTKCKKCKANITESDLKYLACSKFRKIKNSYVTAKPVHAYITIYYSNVLEAQCAIIDVYYTINSEMYYDTVLVQGEHSDGEMGTLDDPIGWAEREKNKAYGSAKLGFIKLQTEILSIITEEQENGYYVNADYLSIGIN